MVFFSNVSLECWAYQEESDELTPYKESTVQYKYMGSVHADFQALSDSEDYPSVGVDVTDTYRAFIPVTTHVTPGMKFRITGASETYSLIGHETVNSRFHCTSHQKLILRCDRKPEPFTHVNGTEPFTLEEE